MPLEPTLDLHQLARQRGAADEERGLDPVSPCIFQTADGITDEFEAGLDLCCVLDEMTIVLFDWEEADTRTGGPANIMVSQHAVLAQRLSPPADLTPIAAHAASCSRMSLAVWTGTNKRH